MHKTINLNDIKEIAVKGVRRGYVFMGLGITATELEELNTFDLSNIVQLQIVPSTSDLETLAHCKDEFKVWIISGGLREATESFAIFLDKVYDVICDIEVVNGRKDYTACQRDRKKFENVGIRDKINILSGQYNINCPYGEIFNSLRLARNCLSHRGGVVNRIDCNNGDSLAIKWKGLNSFIATNDGKLFSLTKPIPSCGIFVEAGGEVQVVLVGRKKFIEIGEVIRLSPSDLAEICWTILLATDEVIKQLIKFVKNSGLPIN